MSDDQYIDKLTMPDQAVKEIVADHYRRAAPTPARPKSLIDALVEKFGKKPAD